MVFAALKPPLMLAVGRRETTIKDGTCPRCRSEEVCKSAGDLDQRSRRVLALFSHVRFEKLIWCNCGVVETCLADMKDVEKVRAKCTKVKASQ
jgi:hypothetical protein